MSAPIFHILFSVFYLSMFGIRLFSWRAAVRAEGGVQLREGKLSLAVRAVLGLGYVGALLVYVFFPASWPGPPSACPRGCAGSALG